MKIWPEPVCARGLANAAVELDEAERNWAGEKKRADEISKIAAYRLSRAVAIYEKFRSMLGEFVEVPEEFPEIEPFESRQVQAVSSMVATASVWSEEKAAAITAERARLLRETMPAPKRVTLQDFGASCFAPEHFPLFSK
jgi:hypothetical protein